MSTARVQLATALAVVLGIEWAIVDYSRIPDSISKHTIVLYRESYRNLPQAPIGTYEHTFSVWVLVSADTTDDVLDDLTDTVTGAVEDIAWAQWVTAERGTFGTYPGNKITVTAYTQKVEA